MDRLRIGVIGSGYWGPNLTRNFFELPTSEVAVVADLDPDRLAAIGSRYPGVTLTTNYQDLFSMQLDAAVVATPPPTHFTLARDCLQNGLHTLVEKPLTLNTADAERLIEIADAHDLTLMVGHTFEYNVAVQTLREIIAAGELGDIYYVNSVRANLGLFQRNLSVLWDLAPHDIAILLYLLGCDPICVSAWGGARICEGMYDISYLHLVFPKNILAHVHVSWLDPCKVRRITVVGSRKMAVYDDMEPQEKLKIYDKGVETLPYTHTYGDFQCNYRYGDVIIPYLRVNEPLRVECQHFVDCVLHHKTPQSSGLDGLKVVKVLEHAEQSMQNNGIEVPIEFKQGLTYEHAFG
jgi:predicted dehydrogenase